MQVHARPRTKLLVGYVAIVAAVAATLLSIHPGETWGIAAMAITSLAAGWLVARLSTRSIRRRIHQLRATAEAIQRGEGDTWHEPPPQDEFQKLTQSMRQLTEQLQQTMREQERLQNRLTRSEKLAIIGELAATVAHEINNPLDGLQNCVRIIRREPENRQQTLQLLSLMDSGLYRMEMIVRRLLSMSRDEPARLAPTRVDEIVTDAILFIQPRLNRNRVSLVRDFPEVPVCVMADRVQLAQVLINLMINAADSMPEGGVLTVACSASPAGERVLLDVIDTGSGIDDAHLPHIFEPFYTTKPQGGGTGLGLAVVARIVEAHGGRITVTSVAGKGTCFRLDLPAAPDRAAARVTSSAAPASA